MSTLPKTFITPEQYLEIDRQAERKSEYYRWRDVRHGGRRLGRTTLIVLNLLRDLGHAA